MNNKPSMPGLLLFFTGLLCIAFLLFAGCRTLREITAAEKDAENVMQQFALKQEELKTDAEIFAKAADEKQKAINQAKQKSENTAKKDTPEQVPEAEIQAEIKPSVFSQGDNPGIFSSNTNGHIIGIDPGHQSYSVDMSGLEPIGPGSSEMKTRASTGTQGTYSGVPEYQLNLDISLKLRDVLEGRGYQVVMTRTDNETAISNSERAQFVAQQGAEICVRIHANGDDSHTASGALTMAPSPQNPYVSQLSEPSVRLSQCILDTYCAATGFQNLGVQYYDNMTGLNWSTIPVTILEMGFMTHEYDDIQMNDPAFQDTMVQGIADGIDAYFNG